MSKKKIFILYPYYWPFYKAGGPVQSLYNLVGYFQHEIDFYLLSFDRDLDGSESTEATQVDQWQVGKQGENIFYTRTITFNLIYQLLKNVDPDVVYVNGLFNFQTTLYGLVASKWIGLKSIIAPRGMLQSWGLKRSKWKKKIYLFLLKSLLGRDQKWHATDESEYQDILREINAKKIFVAPNIPRKPRTGIIAKQLVPSPIRLVFLSLINPNKNLHLVIDALSGLKGFTLDIYGPVVNEKYWDFCKEKLSQNPAIRYLGPIPPWEVPNKLQEYHFFVLPTSGENFGHAIFDSLSSGVPTIISKNTPWKDLEDKKVGLYIAELSSGCLIESFNQIIKLNQDEHNGYRMRSLKYAHNFYFENNFKEHYRFLYSG